MIVYSGTKRDFQRDINDNVIADRLENLLYDLGVGRVSRAEARSFKSSLLRMSSIIGDRVIDDSVQVALEYQIPLTAKRVDFMIGGTDGSRDNVVIVELKQWEDCTPTSRDNVVTAFTGGALRDVAHPSQQAYSYAKLIEHFNEAVRVENIGLFPCAYLHNFKEENRPSICHPKYSEAIKDAPVFLGSDGSKLTDFIAQYVRYPSAKKLFEVIDHGKLKPSKSLQETVGSILNGNDEFEMIDEQQVAYATVLKLVQNSIGKDEKHTIIVQGGPGTGKSVIAINLLAKILNNGFSASYVTKTSAPRYTFSQSLIKDKYTLKYLQGLFKSAGTFYDIPPNTFDCLLTDEAHRLNLKSGLYSNRGENQIKEIISAAKISVFFIDEDQTVTMKDIGTVKEIKRQAAALGAKVHCGDSLKLTSQFRCNGSDGYIAFLDDVLQIRETANYDSFDMGYDIRLFRDACEMREELRKQNGNNKARMIAGYCYPWASQKDKTQMDILLPGGFEAQWNFTTDRFATDPDSFEQVGCIHSTQGLEFDYVGVIIGTDLTYSNGQVIADYKRRAKSDASVKGIKSEADKARANRIVRNTYKTLLSRGQKGCFIYCEDDALADYIQARLEACQKKPIIEFTDAAQKEALSKKETVIEFPSEQEREGYVDIPCLGAIAAGYGIIMEQDIERFISTPKSLLHPPEPGKYFWLRVSGQSMQGKNINDGDYALIRRMSNPKGSIHKGDIVAFQVQGEEATLKTWRGENGEYIVLHPENPDFEDIHVSYRDLYNEEARFLGKMIYHIAQDELE